MTLIELVDLAGKLFDAGNKVRPASLRNRGAGLALIPTSQMSLNGFSGHYRG
ncbi:MAG: hypothetical protein ACHQUC_04080 [Chlamydiales bacterium]